VQTLFVLMILLAATVAILEFGIAILVKQTVVASAAAGARALAAGGSPPEVLALIAQRLRVHGIEIGPTAGACIRLESAGSAVSLGNPAWDFAGAGPTPSADEVRVTINVLMTQNNRPIPDWLAACGISLRGKLIRASSLALLE
jgi:hypothetical protein